MAMKITNAISRDAYLELLELQEERERTDPGKKRKATFLESKLQQRCVAWFRAQSPDDAPLLVAVPNAARRNVRTGAIMKREGLTAGVADLILLEARGQYGALCIEMKTTDRASRQRKSQKEWQEIRHFVFHKFRFFQHGREILLVFFFIIRPFRRILAYN